MKKQAASGAMRRSQPVSFSNHPPVIQRRGPNVYNQTKGLLRSFVVLSDQFPA